MPLHFPATVVTERLLLRPWRVADAARLKAAIDDNLAHLQPWMPWALLEPSPLGEIEERIEKFAAELAADGDGVYGIFTQDESEVLGGAGLHRRIADGLEIGYWIDLAHTRRGYAAEAARALAEVAFRFDEVRQVQIRCDPRNLASAAVPRRLGFHHAESLVAESLAPAGAPRDTMVWQMTRERLAEDGA